MSVNKPKLPPDPPSEFQPSGRRVRKKKDTRHPGSDLDLGEEIAMLKDGIRQVFELAVGAEQPVETLRMMETLGLTSVRLARLLKVQHELGQDEDEVAQALSAALDEIIKDWESA